MRPSDAGPVLPLPLHVSSSGSALFWWRTPPIEKTFLAQACGRESWLPALLWLCVHAMSLSKTASWGGARTFFYTTVSAEADDAVVWLTSWTLTRSLKTCQRDVVTPL